jgi:lipopolysaccharide transport system ATP-binding protein
MKTSETVLEMDHVAKKFKKGEAFDSLRDLIPALSGRVFTRKKRSLAEHEFWALKDVSFQVARGEAFGIIGPNGAGKSTILKLLCRVMKPTEGRIVVNGTMSALIEVGAGFHPDLTGRENIFLNGAILGMKKEQIRKRFDEIVEFSGLADFIDTPVKRYSSGMYARLGFSVAAHVDPDILIVDEVLSVGDHLFQVKCGQKMKQIKEDAGATVKFVSHNHRAVAELCDRLLLLERGECVQLGPPGEVINSYLNRILQRPVSFTHGVGISKVTVRGRTGEQVHFESGEKAWIEIEVCATKHVSGLGLAIGFKTQDHWSFFDTSTSRLGKRTFSVGPDRTVRYTFELDLHLGPGSYYFDVALYRYDAQMIFDEFLQAGTLMISTEKAIHGIANLYPVAYEQDDISDTFELMRSRPGVA